MASGGYLTLSGGKPVKLQPDVATVHGESSLPGVGGVSHSVVESPKLPFAPWITYGRCETRAQGFNEGNVNRTILTASVDNVQVKTRPSPEDGVPDIKEIAVLAKHLVLSVESLHPGDKQPLFRLNGKPVLDGLSIRFTSQSGKGKLIGIELDFDHPLMDGQTTFEEYERKFRSDQKFFAEYKGRHGYGKDASFGKPLPRDVEGYVVTSIVKQFRLEGDKEPHPGNEYFTPGFGRVIFGTLLANEYSRRVTLVRVRMGSDPKGSSDHCGADTNGLVN